MVKSKWLTFLLLSFCASPLLVTTCAEDVEESSSEKAGENVNNAVVNEEKKSSPIEPPEFVVPEVPPGAYFVDSFVEKSGLGDRWIISEAKKGGVENEAAKYDGEWSINTPENIVLKNDYGLIMQSKARHHAISSKLLRPFSFIAKKPLVVQYEVKSQHNHGCGGAYIKLLTGKDLNLRKLTEKTSYSIMFGPDKCGHDLKLHFIVRFKNPKTSEVTEHHAKQSSKSIDSYFSDQKSHLYKLVLDTDSSYKIYIDQEEVSRGSMLTDFDPPIVPPAEIDDPDHQKPDNWDDKEKIIDVSAKKPDDWDENAPEEIDDVKAKKPEDWLDDEPEYVHDETKIKPEDWDEEMDGTWEPPLIKNKKCQEASGCGQWRVPLIKNPDYRGKWKAPMIPNPNYKGEWRPRKIKNQKHFEMTAPFTHLFAIEAIGLELWTMTEGTMFDNFLIVDDLDAANKYSSHTWFVKQTVEALNDEKTSFINDIVKKTKDNPWMWVIWSMVVLVPVILFGVCCCWNRMDEDEIEGKKTDLSTSDVDTAECNYEIFGAKGDSENEAVDEGHEETLSNEESPNKSTSSKNEIEIGPSENEDEGSFIEHSPDGGIRHRFKKDK